MEEKPEMKTDRYKRLPEGLDSEVLMCTLRTVWLKPPTSWELEDCRFPTGWKNQKEEQRGAENRERSRVH